MFEWKDRKFEFRVPTPFDGCAIFDGITSYSVPFGAEGLLGISSKRAMNPVQLVEFQKLCLRYCFEVLTNPQDPEHPHKAPVVDNEGGFGVTNVTAPLLTALTTQFIVFFTHWWRGELPSDSAPAAPDTPR